MACEVGTFTIIYTRTSPELIVSLPVYKNANSVEIPITDLPSFVFGMPSTHPSIHLKRPHPSPNHTH